MSERLTGKRIVLRKARMEDLDDIFPAIYGDAELLETMFMNLSPDREAAKARLARTIEMQKDKPLYFCALKDTDTVIGLGGMFEKEPGKFSEAGLAIARPHQNRGYGKEMLALLLEEAFLHQNADCFCYDCMAHNAQTKALPKFFGFSYAKTTMETRERDGKTFAVEEYVLTQDSYLTWRQAHATEKPVLREKQARFHMGTDRFHRDCIPVRAAHSGAV